MSKITTEIKNTKNHEILDNDASFSSLSNSMKKNSAYTDEKEHLTNQNSQSTTHFLKQNEKLNEINSIIQNIFTLNILIIICSIFLKLISNRNDGLPVACISISMTSFIFNVLIILFIKYFFTNDPNNTKLLRALIFIEILLLFTNFGFQFAAFINDFIKLSRYTVMRVIFYLALGISTSLFSIISFRVLNLFFDSFLILINKKKEYTFLFDNKTSLQNNLNLKMRILNDDNDRNNIHPMYQKFHNSVCKNRKDDEYYRKID